MQVLNKHHYLPCYFILKDELADALLCDSADHVDVDSWTHVHGETAVDVCTCLSTCFGFVDEMTAATE